MTEGVGRGFWCGTAADIRAGSAGGTKKRPGAKRAPGPAQPGLRCEIESRFGAGNFGRMKKKVRARFAPGLARSA